MSIKQIRLGWLVAFGLVTALGLAVSPAGAAPTPIASCQTLMAGSFVLTQSIKTKGNCFVIGANGVALDLGGFSVTGDNKTGAAITDNGNAFQQIIIAHGNISKFSNGIDLSHSQYVTIDSVNSSHNKGNGIAIGGFSNSITAVTTSFNFGEGLHIGSCCNLIAKVTSTNNKGNGLFSADCCALATQITSTNNHGNGVELDGCCSFLTAATVTSNKGFGFSSDNCCNSITGSTISKSGNDGVALGSKTKNNGADNSINGSTLTKNRGNGLSANSFDNLINNVTVGTNAKDGIFLTSDGFQLVTNTTVTKNHGNGINLSNADAEDGVVLTTVQSNHKAGVIVACPSNLYSLTSTKNKKGSNLVTSGAGCVNLDSNDAP